MVNPTYFTCTLGQAAALGLQQPHKTVTEFVDSQAKKIPTFSAAGFARPNADSNAQWTDMVFTFVDIQRGSRYVASLLLKEYERELARHPTVALLCPSTPEFLFTWLALMRLDKSVLLIAPQCQPAAVAELCKTCKASFLLCDDVYQQLAGRSACTSSEQGWPLTTAGLPFPDDPPRAAFIPAEDDSDEYTPDPSSQESDIAYLHHTSGTSSGMPKPIPQSHHAAVGVLPSFNNGHEAATFTTTPLYHGGIADLFRAWSSNALIWLFPGKRLPITASNVVQCLAVAERSTQIDGRPPVKYFSSVPYVLQMLEENSRGLAYLQGMNIVGVGGAALPLDVGSRLADHGVNLISRFGSAECGFLMSSHRDYKRDMEWQFLRIDSGAQLLHFEPGPDETSELIVMKDWPHMAKRNRDDSSYATSDLFVKHETIADAWRYHSRADSQLTLITGKKFDPAPLEAAIAGLGCLDDVLIFGNGRQIPGALLFRSKRGEHFSDSDLLDELWPEIERLNSETQDHARLSRAMLVAMVHLETPLEKSSKGTIIRKAVEQRFQAEIEQAYDRLETVEPEDILDGEMENAITRIITGIVGKKGQLEKTTDLFSYGVDSVAGIQIRHKLRSLLPRTSNHLPINVVDDCGCVERLSEYVLQRRHGQDEEAEIAADTVHQQMRNLAREYSSFNASYASDGDHDCPMDDKGDVVVLTGATGALGAHILDQYRRQERVKRIYCLVRGADEHAAIQRVDKALSQRKLQCLEDESKIVVLQTQLGDAHLGLEQTTYDRLAREATIIMHVAWSVNFKIRLRSFVKDNIAGVRNLINLALASPKSQPPRFGFCSSVASVMAVNKDIIPDDIIDDPAAATNIGYSQSKWVAEQICSAAGQNTRLKSRMTVFRVGQLAGDTLHGIWNTQEAWPLMLSSVKATGCLPALPDEPLSWLPVDVAASALIQGVQVENGNVVSVLHVVNEHRQPDWESLLVWLSASVSFQQLAPSEWVVELERLSRRSADHPALQLLDHWHRLYSRGADTKPVDSPRTPVFSMIRTKTLVPALRDVKAVDKTYVKKLWTWIDKTM